MYRQFEILYLLLNKKNTTAKNLAEHFGVSQRTIYRDIDTLSLAGIPIYTGKGKGGGIGLLPEFILDKSILNEQEQNEILSALQGLTSVKMAEANQILKKLSTIFNKNIVNWIEVDFSNWNFNDDNLFNDLKTAILEKRVVKFDYYGSSGEKTCRRVEPMQLWFRYRTWYVKGFCLTKQEMRTFKLTRIKNLRITEKYFSERTLQKCFTDMEFVEQKNNVKLKLKIAPEMAYRVYDEFGVNTPQKQPDGSFIVSATLPEDNWVYGTILSYGEYIKVLSPKHIQKIIKEKAQKINQKYL
jgi:predicted DNA-binding transcriptional regulator YafY